MPTDTSVIGLGVTTGGSTSTPCWDEKVSPKTESEIAYPFLAVKATGCGNFGENDEYATAIDNGVMSDVYTNNNIATAYNQIPDYANY